MITGIALKRLGRDCGSVARVVAGILQAVCLALLVGVTAAERAHAAADPASERAETGADIGTPQGARSGGDAGGSVHASPGPLFAQSGAQPQAADAAPQSVGIVSSLQGSASVARNGTTAALKVQDEIFTGDVLKTGQGSTLGIIFDDETTFSLTANASISVDDFVYAEGGDKNAANFKFVRGTVAFVANAVAKTGDMTLSTPTATMGIRGTTGLVNVGPTGATSGADAIKLYPDADGKVGRIEVKARDGTSLGVLTRPATGFSLQRGMGGGARVVATPLQISPQQAALDQNLVRQVHAERQRGQALVAQRRAARPHGPAPRNGMRGEPRPPTPAVRPPGPQKPPAVRRGPVPRPAFPPKGKPPKAKRGR